MDNFHTSVMPTEAVDALQVREGKTYIDCTLGGGGHTLSIAELGGRVLSIDLDEDAIRHFQAQIDTISPELVKRIEIVNGNFANLETIVKDRNAKNVSGILFDLGVSSHQFNTGSRGFSIQHDGPLDMRMGTSLGVSARDLINALSAKELVQLFEKYGEERFARRIATTIVEARKHRAIETTSQLAEVIVQAVGRREKVHPATRVFQALRIAVNDELYSLESALQQAIRVVERGGRIVTISFHSLEDRIIKQTFQSFAEKELGFIVTKKPLLPSESEIAQNARARSAKLRVFERI